MDGPNQAAEKVEKESTNAEQVEQLLSDLMAVVKAQRDKIGIQREYIKSLISVIEFQQEKIASLTDTSNPESIEQTAAIESIKNQVQS